MIRLPALQTGAAASLLAVSLVAAGLAFGSATPAAARVDVSFGINFGGISFGYFHNNLGHYGSWIQHPRWGNVWRPPHARSFRPYYDGYWEDTDEYGMYWVSNEPWGDIIYHYGRLVWDPHYGWLWIPGYVWSPAWVVFREGNGYLGWMAMPPDYGDFDDGPYFGGNYGWDDYYGYNDWYGMNADAFYGLWIFVDDDHFYRRDYRNYVVDSHHVPNIIRQTSDTTNYATANDHIVNRSVPIDRLERATHQRIRPVAAREFIKTTVPRAPVSAGRGIAQQEGSGRPGHNVHDRNFKPLNTPAGNQNGPLNLKNNEKNNGGSMGRGGQGEGSANQPGNERKGVERKRMNAPEATPSVLPQPNAGEDRVRGRNRGAEQNLQPSPQPESQPAPGGEKHLRGRDRGSEENMQSSPQPESQPAPGGEDHGRGRRGGSNPQGQPAGAGPNGASDQQGTQGQDRRSKDKGQQGAQPSQGDQPSNPDQEKHKKRDRNDENGPSQ